MRWNRLILIACSMVTLCTGSAVSKEWEFKGFVFGRTTISDWRATVHRTARDSLGQIVVIAPYCGEEGRYEDKAEVAVGIRRCSWFNPSARDTDAGVAGTMPWLQVGDAIANSDEWVFVDGVLAQYNAILYEAQLGNLLPSLRAKYGEPKMRSEQVQNAFGAKFTNEIYEWHLGNMDIMVQKYFGQLDECGITIFNAALQKTLDTRIERKAVSTSGL